MRRNTKRANVPNIDRDEFITQVAEKAKFTKSDTGILLEAMVDVIKECIENGIDVDIRGFAHIEVVEVKKRTGWSVQEGKAKEYPPAKKIIFRVSENLKELVRSKDVD